MDKRNLAIINTAIQQLGEEKTPYITKEIFLQRVKKLNGNLQAAENYFNQNSFIPAKIKG